jgi:3-phosphoshikimate 1-carboxyvinyltransferase
MMKKLTTACPGLHGSLQVPGDKSISHRAAMMGAIAQGTTRIRNFLKGQDCLTTLQAFKELGVEIAEAEDGTIVIHGQGFAGLQKPSKTLDMGNSGTTTRLLMGLLAGTDFETRLVGDKSLEKRPMSRVAEPLKDFGAVIELSDAGTLPCVIHGQNLHSANVQLQVASAQVKSALIFAALRGERESTIVEQLPTRNHTEIMLRQFGARVETEVDGLTIHVWPGELQACDVLVPGDISSAAFFMTAAAIVPNSDVTLTKVNLNPTRTGIVRVLDQMGAKMTISRLPGAGEPLGNIRVQSSDLRPIELGAKDVPAVIDELPLVALLAACAKGRSKITGAGELRVKETDRIKTVTQELRKLGVEVEELPDGMIIQGRSNWAVKEANLASYGDHRLGMMDAVAALKSQVPLTLADEGAISVSYPGFFSDLEKLLKADRQSKF